ncbi:MAG: conjugal transfer protein TraA, partial [Bacteroidia bacterium]|nr:conjugal transfer protein TraA [Bacteroidia bacterium]
MAIYSLHHSAIGKQTQESRYTASAHVRYITRAKALTRIEGGRMPIVQDEAVSFLNQGEDKDRSNARVIDKVMLALPRELSGDQRVALVKDFAERITQGRASW